MNGDAGIQFARELPLPFRDVEGGEFRSWRGKAEGEQLVLAGKILLCHVSNPVVLMFVRVLPPGIAIREHRA